MSRITGRLTLIALGTALLTGALAIAVRGILAGTETGTDVVTVAVPLTVIGIAAAAVMLWWRPPAADADDDATAHPTGYRRAGRYRLVEDAPERAVVDYPLAGEAATALLARAETRAREEGSVAAGIDVVRPALRELLRDVLVAGGQQREAAQRVIDEGAWTDDPVVAAVYSPYRTPPRRPLRDRIRAWLRPEHVVRERLDLAVGALVGTADEVLPPIPGRDAPRRVRVRPPPLADLRRDVDGSLRSAVEPYRGLSATLDDGGPDGVRRDTVDGEDR